MDFSKEKEQRGKARGRTRLDTAEMRRGRVTMRDRGQCQELGGKEQEKDPAELGLGRWAMGEHGTKECSV